MKVSVLVENTSMDEYDGEHGLSLHIEHGGKNYLVDTGTSALFAKNAKKMGVDLSKVDAAFLSHAHYDHSGGYEEFFQLNDKAKVYLQEACKNKYYYKIVGPVKSYIGIPKGIQEKYEDRFEYVDGYRELENGVYICPHTTLGLEMRGKKMHMYGEVDGKIAADNFSHEQTVVFEENGALYLFNSCSHGGVENIIEEVKKALPDKEIRAFFGGFHLMGTLGVDTCGFKKTEVEEIAAKLLTGSKAVFYTGHCTGNLAGKWLKEAMGNRYVALHSGMVAEV